MVWLDNGSKGWALDIVHSPLLYGEKFVANRHMWDEEGPISSITSTDRDESALRSTASFSHARRLRFLRLCFTGRTE